MDKSTALERIASIARENGLSIEDIAAALNGEPVESSGSVTSRIFATIGGIFILCGLGFFIESFWNAMNAAARIILYLGSGMVMLVLALVFIRNKSYEKSAWVLFLLAAVFQSGGIMVAFDELGTGGDIELALLAMSGVMLVQNSLVLHAHRLSILVFLVLFFAATFITTLLDYIGMDWEFVFTVTGLLLLGAGYRLAGTAYRVIVPFWNFAGGIMASWGVFDILENSPADILYIAYAALLIYFSTLAKSRTLLFVGTGAMIGYLSYFTGEYFADSIGWPLALMIIGILFIALSILAVKINRSYIAGTP